LELNPVKLKSVIATTLFLLAIGNVAHAQKRGLNEAEAIIFAERFIAVNGYTDQAPDKSKLSYETIEWESNLDKMLKVRHDTLEQKAYGIVGGRRGGAAGWTVVFRYKRRSDRWMRRIGRAVTMNPDGAEMRVEHKDFILRNVESIPR
jgi:hypothetical protein